MSSAGAGGRLTTHVLDTMAGRPAAGIAVRLSRLDEGGARTLVEATTNADGRTEAPLLAGEAFAVGHYELIFEVGAYFRARVRRSRSHRSSMPCRSVSPSPRRRRTTTCPC